MTPIILIKVLRSNFEAPQIVIDNDPTRVPELLETDAKKWKIFCLLAWFAPCCTGGYLGMKYEVS